MDGGDRGVLDGWYVVGRCRSLAEVWGGKCGKSAVEACGNGCGMGVKDVVKMVAFCALRKFLRTVAGKFGTIQASTR